MLQKLNFRPGINREGTTLANEGGWFESDKVRFRSGYPEKIGGWVLDTGANASTLQSPAGDYWGICRAMWNWLNLSGYNLLALGTNLKYYIQNGTGGAVYDVTPIRTTTAAGEVTFSASTGSPIITVTDPGHGAQTGDFVTFSGALALSTQTYTANAGTDKITFTTALANGTTIQLFTTSAAPAGLLTGVTYFVVNSDTPTASCQLSLTLGGAAIDITGTGTGTQTFALTTGITAAILNAEFQITYLSSNQYTITASVNADAVDTGNGGSLVVGEYQITTGNDIFTQNVGWGAGSWGGTIVGTATNQLNGAINSSVTTITVDSTVGFAAAGTLLIDSETITYTGTNAPTNTQFTGCTRGVSGTGSGAAASHADNAAVVQSTTFTGWGSPAPAGQGIGEQLRLWSQSNFGEDLVFNPRGGALYYWANAASPNTFNRGELLGPGATITLKSGPPLTVDADCPSIANIVMVSDSSRFVIAFGANDAVAGSSVQNPMFICWSDQEDITTWTPAVTNQAGSFTLSDGSQIVAAIQTRQEILVITDSAIYSMQYLGPPYVWGFQLMGNNISITGPNAVATANNVTYWMGADKFYMYSGRVETLPCSLRQYVYNDINLTQSFQFFASTNEGYNEIWWFYCSANSTTVDKYVIFNHLERTWYYGNLARTYWLDSPLRATPVAAGYNGQLIYHENGNDDGTTNPPTAIEAYVQSSDFDIGDGHNFGLVTRIIPDVTFDGSSVNAPSLNFAVRPRQFPGTNYGTADSPTVASTQNYQNQRYYTVQQFTQQVFVRIRGRQMALRIESNDLGVAWQLGVPRIDTRPDGRR